MYKTIVSRHVKSYGNQFTYFVSLAGEKTRGGLYSGHITAAYEAEILKYYIRHKYGVSWYTMKAHVSDMDLQAYADERGFKLTLEGVFQWLPSTIRDKLVHEGSQIAAAFAELELPLKHKELLQEAVREERQQLKLARIALKDKLSKERAAVWIKAQQGAAEAWRDAKIELEDLREIKKRIQAREKILGVPITREQALEGLGDPATWDAEAKALYAEFEKKPS